MASLNKYETYILEYLQRNKIKVSSELSEQLIESFDIKRENARQIIRRVTQKGIIKSSDPLTFGRGQFAYYLPTFSLTLNKIKAICKEHRPALYRLIKVLELNNGIISYYEALKITASPLITGISKADCLNDLIALLQKLDFIYQKRDLNSVNYIILKSKQKEEENLMNMHFDKMSIDTVLMRDIINWIVKINLIDNNNIIYRNRNTPSKGAKHNNLVWDAFGYTKTTGLNSSHAKDSNSPEKQTLVVLDVLISRKYEQIDLDGFLNRIQINLNSVIKGKRKVIPVVVYKEASRFILNKIKKLGFLSFDIGSIYGSNILRVLENFSKLKIENEKLDDSDFGKVIEETLSIIQASGQDDQLKALKGTLFEVMMYQVLRHQYPNSEITPNFYYNKEITNKTDGSKKTESYEYDYIIKSYNPKEIVVVELKGYKSSHYMNVGDYNKKNTIKWFFSKTLPFLRERFKTDQDSGYPFRGCYITSGGFTPEAIETLEVLKKGSYKPKSMDMYYDRQKLFDFLIENNFNHLKSIIDKFY